MDTIQQNSVMIMMGTVIFIVILGTGCLGFGHQNPTIGNITPVKNVDATLSQNTNALAKCSESSVSGHDMVLNETQNDATICANLTSTLIVRLTDASRTGWEWNLTTSPGLLVFDKGVTLYREKGVPPTSTIEFGIHEWDLTLNDTGIQTINAILRFPGREITGSERTFNLTIIVR